MVVRIGKMEKMIRRSCSCSKHQHWLVFFTVLFLSILMLLRFRYAPIQRIIINSKQQERPNSCSGRFIYIQDPPSRFNRELLDRCETAFTTSPDRNVCPYLANSGIGRRLEDPKRVLLDGSWYATNPFALSVIFHVRMKKYQCLTNDSSLASAVYVPYYAGLDASRNLWSSNISLRDESALEFVKWLGQTPEWKKMWGRDHFLVSGRTSWDNRRTTHEESAWGTGLRFLPESQNMSMLSVESSVWKNDYAIPYPTCFHPSDDSQVFQWQKRMRRRRRRYLFSFAGAPRPNNPETIRAKVIEECRGSNNLCKLLDCDNGPDGAILCDNPVKVIKLFRNSVFCLQPRGDSYTRRSFFDAILAGCIPVLFHPGSAYVQYKWHLPKVHNNYSVYIPVEKEEDWRPGKVNETLLKIPKHRVQAMREEVIRLIPKVIYADPRSRLQTLEDAFDIAVSGILERVERVRREINEGRDPSIGFAEMDRSLLDVSRFVYVGES